MFQVHWVKGRYVLGNGNIICPQEIVKYAFSRPAFPPLCRGTLVCHERLSGVPWKMIKNFLISVIISYYYFKSVLLVIIMSVCGFYKY